MFVCLETNKDVCFSFLLNYIVLCFRNYLTKRKRFSILTNLHSLHLGMLRVIISWHWSSVSLLFLNSVNVLSLFRKCLPLEKGVVFPMNKVKSPSHKESFVPSLKEIDPVVLECLSNFVNWFLLFCNYFPFRKWHSLSFEKLEFSSSKILCGKFGWNWHGCTWEEHFKMYFTYFVNIFNAVAFHLKTKP